jgi:hypothetical protein
MGWSTEKGKIIGSLGLGEGCRGRQESAVNGCGGNFSLEGAENALKLDCGDGYCKSTKD